MKELVTCKKGKEETKKVNKGNCKNTVNFVECNEW